MSQPTKNPILAALETHEDYNLLITAMAKQKKYMKKDDKTNLAIKLLEATNIDGFFIGPHQAFFSEIVQQFKDSGKSTSKRKDKWTVQYIGDRLTKIYFLIKEFNKNRASSTSGSTRNGIGRVLNHIVEKLDKVLQAAKNDVLEQATKSTRNSLNFQSTGERKQDSIVFDATQRDAEKCPVCDHLSCMPLEDRNEFMIKQDRIVAEHMAEVNHYESLTPAQRNKTPKPKNAPSVTSVWVGCFCHQIHCLGQPDGGKCYQCQGFANQVGGDGSHFDSSGGQSCPCDICKCKCQVIFRQHHRTKIALERAIEASEGGKPENTSTISFFGNTILSSLQNAAITASHESHLDQNQLVANAASLGSFDILTSPHLQGNVELRKNLQAAIPRPNGDVMAQLQFGKTSVQPGMPPPPPRPIQHLSSSGQAHAAPPSSVLAAAPSGSMGIHNTNFMRNRSTPRQVELPLSLGGLHDSRYKRNGLNGMKGPSQIPSTAPIDLTSPSPPPPISNGTPANGMATHQSEDNPTEIRRKAMRLLTRTKLQETAAIAKRPTATATQKENHKRAKTGYKLLLTKTPTDRIGVEISDGITAGDSVEQSLEMVRTAFSFGSIPSSQDSSASS